MITDVVKQAAGSSPVKPGPQPPQTQVAREPCKWIVGPVVIRDHVAEFHKHCPGICPHHVCSRSGCTNAACSRVHWGKNPEDKAKVCLDALAAALGPDVKVTER